jgi:hypothetical protein
MRRGAFACGGVLSLEDLEAAISRHSTATNIQFYYGSTRSIP